MPRGRIAVVLYALSLVVWGKLSRTIAFFLCAAPCQHRYFVKHRAGCGASGSPKRASAQARVLLAAGLNSASGPRGFRNRVSGDFECPPIKTMRSGHHPKAR